MRYSDLASHVRLTALGASIGAVAAAVVLVPSAAILHAWSRVLPGGNTAPTFDPTDWAVSLAIANVAAGAVAGALAGSVPISGRARDARPSARAWLICLGGGLTWMLLATALAERPNLSPTRFGVSALLGLALGATLNVASFPAIAAAIGAAGPGFHRQVWAGASRLAALSAALLATMLAGPLTLAAAMAIGGIAIRGWPSDPLAARYIGPLLVAWMTTVAVAVLGLRAAGVPRHWPGERKTSEPPDTG